MRLHLKTGTQYKLYKRKNVVRKLIFEVLLGQIIIPDKSQKNIVIVLLANIFEQIQDLIETVLMVIWAHKIFFTLNRLQPNDF